ASSRSPSSSPTVSACCASPAAELNGHSRRPRRSVQPAARTCSGALWSDLPPGKERPMAWNIEGTYFETCSCDLMFPCNMSFDHGATYDYCRVTLVFNITNGEIEGTDVGGLGVAVIAESPKVMTDGNWRVGMFVDERATDEQTEALAAVFGGQKGGPMEALGPLIGEFLGLERAPFALVEQGLTHSVKIGDAID